MQAQTQGGRGSGRGPVDFWPGLKHLLFVADTQTGYQHDSISHAMTTVEQSDRQSKTCSTMIKTDSQLITNTPIKGHGRYAAGNNSNARIVPFYDAIFMLPSGYGNLSDDQKADLSGSSMIRAKASQQGSRRRSIHELAGVGRVHRRLRGGRIQRECVGRC